MIPDIPKQLLNSAISWTVTDLGPSFHALQKSAFIESKCVYFNSAFLITKEAQSDRYDTNTINN